VKISKPAGSRVPDISILLCHAKEERHRHLPFYRGGSCSDLRIREIAMSKFPLAKWLERSTGVVAADNGVLANRKVSVQEAAVYLGISKSFLDKTRLNGTGPVYLKIGRRVAYDLGDLEIWATVQKRRHTSEIARLPGAVQP
jgi:hypothetical protein